MGTFLIFVLLAIVCIGAAAGMLLSRNAVHSALFLALNFTTVGVLYLLLNAPFIAMVQITVYAGAIMVLFLFVIMLLGAERLEGLSDAGAGGPWQRVLAVVLVLLLLVAVGVGILPQIRGSETISNTVLAFDASPSAIGRVLFESYVFPFEVTSILLLVAMIAVVVWRTGKKKEGA